VAPGDKLDLANLQAIQFTVGARFLNSELPVVEIGRLLVAE
jgi:hypothetical protein